MKQHKKANVAAKLAARPVKYNLMVGYDPILETEVSLVLQKNHLETKITTETYFYMKDLTKEEAERIKKLVQDVKFEFKSPKTGNLKVYKVRYISATVAPEINLGKLKRINKKKVAGKVHSPGSKSTNYDKKLSKRVKKATLAMIKAESKKAVATPKRAKFKGSQKPVQQKLNFKAAA